MWSSSPLASSGIARPWPYGQNRRRQSWSRRAPTLSRAGESTGLSILFTQCEAGPPRPGVSGGNSGVPPIPIPPSPAWPLAAGSRSGMGPFACPNLAASAQAEVIRLVLRWPRKSRRRYPPAMSCSSPRATFVSSGRWPHVPLRRRLYCGRQAPGHGPQKVSIGWWARSTRSGVSLLRRGPCNGADRVVAGLGRRRPPDSQQALGNFYGG